MRETRNAVTAGPFILRPNCSTLAYATPPFLRLTHPNLSKPFTHNRRRRRVRVRQTATPPPPPSPSPCGHYPPFSFLLLLLLLLLPLMHRVLEEEEEAEEEKRRGDKKEGGRAFFAPLLLLWYAAQKISLDSEATKNGSLAHARLSRKNTRKKGEGDRNSTRSTFFVRA